jgi:drug/metabolite transporter (DMT)-like permease
LLFSCSPRTVGVVLIMITAVCGGINASITHALADADVAPVRINQFRFVVAFLVLGSVLLAVRPQVFRVARAAVPRLLAAGMLVAFGTGLAYIVAISRLQIGAALALVYTSPLILLAIASVRSRRAPRPAAIVAGLVVVAGCTLVVQATRADELDPLGVAAALVAAAAFAGYVTLVGNLPVAHSEATIVVVMFGIAAVTLSLWPPLWTFPVDQLTATTWLGLVGVMVFATLVPYLTVAGATLRLPGPLVGILMTLEPVLATTIAWITLGQALSAWQVLGICMVLAAAVLAQARGFADVHPLIATERPQG